MAQQHSPRPPAWASALLARYCKPGLLEDLDGDLTECFQKNVLSKGLRRARLIYVIDVLKFFKPYIIRRPSLNGASQHYMMLGSYFKTSVRTISRNKLFSAINVIGLAVSMSVGLLMIAFLSDMFSYDDFQKNKSRIYRVITADRNKENQTTDFASSSVKAGKDIEEGVPGVDATVILRNGFGGDARTGEHVIPLNGLYASQSFFKVFSFPLLSGNPATALIRPWSLVLTETASVKLFGTTDAIGKSVTFDTAVFLVTGVMKDFPKSSHFKTEVLVSFKTAEILNPSADGGFLNWESIYSNYIYILASKTVSTVNIQSGLDRICDSENAHLQNRKISLSLQPLESIAIHRQLVNEIGPNLNVTAVSIMIGLTVVVILSACFNYTNLSIARSIRRSKEVGIRKVIGASKLHVVGQFITESIVLSVLATVVSFVLFLFLRTQFLSLHSFISSLVSLEVTPRLLGYFLLLAIAVGLVAGIIPAFVFSKIKIINVLKDFSSVTVLKNVSLRKSLLIVQYTFSLIFITTTMVGYNQYKSFIKFNLGFSTENILNIELQNNKAALLKKELSSLPEVTDISRSTIVTSLGSMYGSQLNTLHPADSGTVWLNDVDERFVPLHKHQLIAGKNFNPTAGISAEGQVIVNEQLVKRFGGPKATAESMIGEIVVIDKKQLKVVAVVRDFHYGTMENPIDPMALRYITNESGGHLNVKVSSQDMTGTLERINTVWKKIDNVHPLNAAFYDDQINQAYSQFSMMLKVIGFLSFLAICISSMGLFGMVVFTAETRLKEISIRKVLGAGEGRLILLLSSGFIVMLTISAAIALPLTFYLFEKVILVHFIFHAPIGTLNLFSGFIGVMLVAIIMIASQTLHVARANPAEVLKNE